LNFSCCGISLFLACLPQPDGPHFVLLALFPKDFSLQSRFHAMRSFWYSSASMILCPRSVRPRRLLSFGTLPQSPGHLFSLVSHFPAPVQSSSFSLSRTHPSFMGPKSDGAIPADLPFSPALSLRRILFEKRGSPLRLKSPFSFRPLPYEHEKRPEMPSWSLLPIAISYEKPFFDERRFSLLFF